MKRRISLIAVAAAAACTLAPSFAQAQAKTVIKIGWTTSDGAQDPYAVGARAFKEAAERLSKGTLDIHLFPNRQLGDERQMLEGMRFGTVDGGVITNAVVAQIDPAFQLYDLPFLFSNEAQAHKVLDGEVGQEMAKRLPAKGLLLLGQMEGGFRSMVNNKRPVDTPDDVKGVKFRVMQNPVYIGMFNSLGGSAIPMAWGETFTAVQQGTIDGLEIPLAVIQANKYFEVTKFLSLTNHTYSVLNLVISKRNFERLKPEQQTAMRQAAVEATAAQRKQALNDSQEILADLKAKGMQVNTVANVAPFRSAVKPVYDKFRESGTGSLLDKTLAAAK